MEYCGLNDESFAWICRRRMLSSVVAPPLAIVDGQPINLATLPDAVNRIIERLAAPGSFLVCTLNLDHLVKLRHDAGLRRAYARAEFVTADGFPIVTLAGLNGATIQRTAGSDLIEPLCRAAAQRHLPVFLFGTTFATLCQTARRLTTSCPGLDIAGVYAPPSRFDLGSTLADQAIALIGESGARICFVALGAPLQEQFASKALDATSGVAFLPIGGGLDFIAGTQVRCPRALQQLNLEWAWRLALNPRRLLTRYVQCAILFSSLLLHNVTHRSQRRFRRL